MKTKHELRECTKIHHFDIRNTKKFSAEGAQPNLTPSVPLSEGLDTRPCKILDPPLNDLMWGRVFRRTPLDSEYFLSACNCVVHWLSFRFRARTCKISLCHPRSTATHRRDSDGACRCSPAAKQCIAHRAALRQSSRSMID